MAKLNMYQRLRDFSVPVGVLDEIFSNEDDLSVLTEAWEALQKDKLNEDEIARKISAIIHKEINIPSDHGREEKK